MHWIWRLRLLIELAIVCRLTNVFGIVQGRYVDIASLPGQEASECHQESLVSVNGTDENRHVITLAVFVLRPDFGVVLTRVRLLDSIGNWKSITRVAYYIINYTNTHPHSSILD
jgi:hypothetical protein